jgi:crotonobetainyl-CoA:carnitine CoA-transferase CaiB-like acyl-CoA transferase
MGEFELTAAFPRPLGGLRVLEVGGGIAPAFCGKLLAALGADVIKIEPPAGDRCRRVGPFARDRADPESSLLFLYLNTSKRGITLDPTTPTGAHLFRRLAAAADIVVEALGPGRLGQLGLGYGVLARENPGLILTSITPFGDEGPYRDYLDGELVLLALGGLLNMVGALDREPIPFGGYQAQYAAGLAAFTGTMVALTGREVTGHGQEVTISAQETVAYLEWKTPIYYQSDGRVRRRGGEQSQWMVLPCSDGFVAFVFQDEHWPQVKKLVGDPRLENLRFADRPGRVAHRGELREILAGWTRARTKAKVYHGAQALGIPVGMVADAADLVASPQYRARGFFARVDHPRTGPALYPGIPFVLDGHRPPVGRAPLLGEHNLEVYTSLLGLSAAEIAGLRERGVI